MPELAEVETIRLQLDELIVGKAFTDFRATHPRSIRRHENQQEIADAILGKEILRTARHGKYLAIITADTQINIHLRMSGRIVAHKKNEPAKLIPHTHVIFKTDSHSIAFIDPRTFGEIWLGETIHRGIDALSTKEELLDVLNNYKSSRMIKTILLDQNIIAGIGNIYADEICAASYISPSRRFNEISAEEKDVLASNILKVLNTAIKNKGSSLKDESFKDLYGNLGHQQHFNIVHGKIDQLCEKCSSAISKIKISGRTSYFCPKCQK